jgi:uncharacterized Zn finger protein (UPF0148 family)
MDYTCPNCGGKLSDGDVVGGVCPNCHKLFDLPQQSNLPDTEPKNDHIRAVESESVTLEQQKREEEKDKFYKEIDATAKENLSKFGGKLPPKNWESKSVPKQPSDAANRKWGCLGFIGLCIMLTIIIPVCSRLSEVATYKKLQTQPIVELTAWELGNEWSINKLAAESKYKDKVICLSGKVTAVGREAAGRPYMLFDGGDYDIQCIFPTLATEGIAKNIKTGYFYKNICGVCKGELLGIILLEDCFVKKK